MATINARLEKLERKDNSIHYLFVGDTGLSNDEDSITVQDLRSGKHARNNAGENKDEFLVRVGNEWGVDLMAEYYAEDVKVIEII